MDVELAATTARNVSEAARRYAGALFELADGKGELPVISGELAQFASLVDDNGDLARALASPIFPRDQKAAALIAVAEKAGLGKTTTAFLATMAENGRAGEIVDAIAAFDAKYAEHRGVKRARAVTATEMTADQRKRLEQVLVGALGGDVELETAVDPALVGGIQLRIGSQLIDASIAAKLDRMNIAMKGA